MVDASIIYCYLLLSFSKTNNFNCKINFLMVAKKCSRKLRVPMKNDYEIREKHWEISKMTYRGNVRGATYLEKLKGSLTVTR